MEVKQKAWFPVYLFSAWLGHFCQGLGMGILGPTQPYLAAQVKELISGKTLFKVGVPNHQISFIWTGRALGNCLAAVLASFVFRWKILHFPFLFLVP